MFAYQNWSQTEVRLCSDLTEGAMDKKSLTRGGNKTEFRLYSDLFERRKFGVMDKSSLERWSQKRVSTVL